MRALIIDDEPMPAKHLKAMLEQHCFEIDSIEIINSPIVGLERLKSNPFDLLFLDVEMPKMDGFALLEKAQLSHRTQVIFTTAYAQYAIDAFKANAAHYILKPATKEELINAVRKAVRILPSKSEPDPLPSAKNDVISVYYKDEHHIIKTSEIIRIEGSRSYSSVILKDKKLLSSKGLGVFEKKLVPPAFFRCHKSHLINLNRVRKVGKGRNGYVILSNSDMVPIAQSKKEEFEQIMEI